MGACHNLSDADRSVSTVSYRAYMAQRKCPTWLTQWVQKISSQEEDFETKSEEMLSCFEEWSYKNTKPQKAYTKTKSLDRHSWKEMPLNKKKIDQYLSLHSPQKQKTLKDT